MTKNGFDASFSRRLEQLADDRRRWLEQLADFLARPSHQPHKLEELEALHRLTGYRYRDMMSADYRLTTEWRREHRVIALPPPDEKQDVTLISALKKRRSRRDYLPEPISPQQLSNLLFMTYGKTAARKSWRDETIVFRTAPSAGALYAVDLFVVIHRVEDMEPGLYLFQPGRHQLITMLLGDCRRDLVAGGLDQYFLADAAVVFALVAVTERMFWKYGIRGYRYLFLDAGHIAQNAYLAAEALGLGACEIAAFYDDYLNSLFQLDERQTFLLTMVSIGKTVQK
jgi:SagB-type dehydrogenase family enzyme